MNSFQDKLEDIKRILNADLLAADIKLSLFISAANSFKQDTLLTPFPKCYIENGVKCFSKLTSDLNDVSDVDEVMTLIMSDNTSHLSESTVDLIHLMLTSNKFSIETIPRQSHDNVLSLCKNTGKISTRPNFIFKVNYADSGAESRFRNLVSQQDDETKYAFHGTRFYNVFSILNLGLQQHLNKQALFGEGLYFAQELEVSLLFSPSVLGWSKSRLGDVISCVLVCEYINDHAYVKVRKENAKNSDIPQSYLLITNNEVVRVRYLLIYCTKKAAGRTSTTRVDKVATTAPRTGFLTWCRKNPLIVSAVLYVFLLFLVGISKSRFVHFYTTNIMKFLSDRLKFV